MRCTRSVLKVFAVILIALFQTTAQAQTDPAWLDELKAQIFTDQNCNPNYYLT